MYDVIVIGAGPAGCTTANAGEIAGFLNPMGEGISAGMESSFHAANAIFEHFGDLDAIYNAYKKGTAPLKTYMERQWSFVCCCKADWMSMGFFVKMRTIRQ